jgi:hypothetical protein
MSDRVSIPAGVTRPPASAREASAHWRSLEDRSRKAARDLEALRDDLAGLANASTGLERAWWRAELRLAVMRQAVAIEAERTARAALAELGGG